MLLRRPGKEPLGGGHITPSAQEEVDRAARFIDGPVQVDPLAFHLDISLVHAPRVTHRQGVRLPTLFKIRHVALHPPQDRRMSQQDAALGHHLDQVTGTELQSEVPSHTQNDDLLVKVPPLEQILCRGRFRHPGRYGCAPVFSSLHQNLVAVMMHSKKIVQKSYVYESGLISAHFWHHIMPDFTVESFCGAPSNPQPVSARSR